MVCYKENIYKLFESKKAKKWKKIEIMKLLFPFTLELVSIPLLLFLTNEKWKEIAIFENGIRGSRSGRK